MKFIYDVIMWIYFIVNIQRVLQLRFNILIDFGSFVVEIKILYIMDIFF